MTYPVTAKTMVLRPYQTEAVQIARKMVGSGKSSVLFVSPTGSGKTVIIAHLCMLATEKGKRVDFMSHRAELNAQCAAKLIEAGINEKDICIYGGGKILGNAQAPIRIGSVQTLHGIGARKSDILFVDEAHRSMARQHRELIGSYREQGAIVLGFTATPARLDGDSLGDVYDQMVIVATPSELVEEGFIINPVIYTVPEKDLPKLDEVPMSHGDYTKTQLAEATARPELVGSIVDHWMRRSRQRSICFAVNRQHSKSIVDSFSARGIKALHIDGQSSDLERNQAIASLRNGEVMAVSQCELWIEGVDIPEVRCAILARPTQSITVYLQSVGRVVRPYKDLPAMVLDHAGNVRRLGLPMDNREWSLEKSKKKSVSVAKAKACPDCYIVVVLNAKECPECGCDFSSSMNERVIRTRKEELVLLKEQEVWDRRKDQWLRYWEEAWTTKDPALRVRQRFLKRYNVSPREEWIEPPRPSGPDIEKAWLKKASAQAFFTKEPWQRVIERFEARFGHKP